MAVKVDCACSTIATIIPFRSHIPSHMHSFGNQTTSHRYKILWYISEATLQSFSDSSQVPAGLFALVVMNTRPDNEQRGQAFGGGGSAA